jgi:hypothetical protein
MPRRADFSIRDLVKVLPQTGIVELHHASQGTRFFVRLNGSALDHFFAPLTGRFIDEARVPVFRGTVGLDLHGARQRPCTGARCEPDRVPRPALSRRRDAPAAALGQDGETASGVLYAVFHYSSNEVNARRVQVYEALWEEHERYCRDDVTSNA